MKRWAIIALFTLVLGGCVLPNGSVSVQIHFERRSKTSEKSDIQNNTARTGFHHAEAGGPWSDVSPLPL